MTKLCLWSAGLAITLCSAVSAQDRDRPPPAPGGVEVTTSPKTFVEETSPATFGATVVRSPDGRLLVRDIVPGSAAALAGIAVNDQIISINGTLITEPEQFQTYLTAHPADEMRIVAMRDGAQDTFVVNSAVKPVKSTARPALGLRFLQGTNVVLGEVLPGSPAALAGLRPGDQIVAVNNTALTSSDHFIALIAESPLTSTLELTYLRGGNRATVSISPDAWDAVFGSGSQYVALKPSEAVEATTAGVAPCSAGDYSSTYGWTGYYPTAPWFSGYVSAVGVPSIAFPTYYGFPYGATYWASPYYYSGYYGYYVHPNWYLHSYGWPVLLRSGGPFPGHPGPRKVRTESAQVPHQSADERVVEQLGTP